MLHSRPVKHKRTFNKKEIPKTYIKQSIMYLEISSTTIPNNAMSILGTYLGSVHIALLNDHLILNDQVFFISKRKYLYKGCWNAVVESVVAWKQ